MWQANVFTIFPKAFPGNLGVSIIGKALSEEKWDLNIIDLKEFPFKSDRIDDTAYGGGVGMILSPITFAKAFDTLSDHQKKMPRFYLSPRGRQLNQQDIQSISKLEGVNLLCGRYEGVDQRILGSYLFQEISIGDFILLGGEVAAMTIIEACVRLLPNVVGNQDSIKYDSFQDFLLEHNQYTRPQIFNNISVPEVLLSGNHEKISKYQKEESKKITKNLRKDIWIKYISQKLCESQ